MMDSPTQKYFFILVGICSLTWALWILNWSVYGEMTDDISSNITVSLWRELELVSNRDQFEAGPPGEGEHRWPASDNKSKRENSLSDLSNDVTVVTAYINIGRFQKGEGWTYFTPNLYKKWMNIFKRIENPLIVYLEDDNDIALFKYIRRDFPGNMTNIVKVSRNDTWAFSLYSKIAEIYSHKSYPKHHPNTVVPEYSCTMHAKYEFMSKAVSENPFRTKYFCWLDIGLFRSEAGVKDKESNFHMGLPPKFEEKKVAYAQVYYRNKNYSAKKIFYSNVVWVCGCFFIAKVDVMAHWTAIYMNNVEYYLSQGLMNTDQQVLYAMFNDKKSTVDLQAYKGDRRYNAWFSLGYISREYGKKTNGG